MVLENAPIEQLQNRRYEIVGYEGATLREGAFVENIGGRTFATRQEAEQFILEETKRKTSGGQYLPYEERFASSFAKRFGYGTGEIRETQAATPRTFTSQPLSRSQEESRREAMATQERRQSGISLQEELQLKQLEKARAEGQISQRSYQELAQNIANKEELERIATQQRAARQQTPMSGPAQPKDDLDRIRQEIERGAQVSAGQALAALPESYRTPENIRNVAEYAGAVETQKEATFNTRIAQQLGGSLSQQTGGTENIYGAVGRSLPEPSFFDKLQSEISAKVPDVIERPVVQGTASALGFAANRLERAEEQTTRFGAPVLDPAREFFGKSAVKLGQAEEALNKESLFPSIGRLTPTSPTDEFIQSVKEKKAAKGIQDNGQGISIHEETKPSAFKKASDIISGGSIEVLERGVGAFRGTAKFGEFVTEKPIEAVALGGLFAFSPTAAGVGIVGGAGLSAYQAPLGTKGTEAADFLGGTAVLAGGIRGISATKQKFFTETKGDIITDVIAPNRVVVEELKTIGKESPSLGKVDITREELVRVEKVNLSPEEYAKFLDRKGEIKYDPSFNFDVVEFGGETILPAGAFSPRTRELLVSKGLAEGYGEDFFQETIAHELIHSKTPRSLFEIENKLDLPYRKRPSEIAAFGLQKRFAERGFDVNVPIVKDISIGELSFRTDSSSLIFEYPRAKVTQSTQGFNEPSVSVSRGTITRGQDQFSLLSVQVGRDVIGVLKGPSEDILLSKSPKGKLETTTFKKGDILVDESLPIPILRLRQGATMLEKSIREFTPERMSMRQEKTIGKMDIQKDLIKIGVKEGDNNVFPQATIKQEGSISLVGEQRDFIGGRDISKAFLGQAETRLLQKDVAGIQTDITQIGSKKLFDFKLPDLEYVIQPKYESAIKIFRTEQTPEGIQSVTTFTSPAPLKTTRINEFASSSRYSFQQSGIRPLKAVGKFLEPFTTIPEEGPLFSSLIPLPSTIGRTAPKVQLKTPELDLLQPSRRPSFSAEDLLPILPERTSPLRLLPSLGMETNTILREETRFQQNTISALRLNLRPTLINETRARNDTRLDNFLRIRPESRREVRTRTEQRLNTELRTNLKLDLKVTPITRVDLRNDVELVPPPKVPRIITFRRGERFREEENAAYDVYLRRGDKRGNKFVKIADDLPYNKALSYGARAADGNIENSFRVVKDGTKKAKEQDDFFAPDLSKFRYPKGNSKLPTGTFVEKRKFRLDDPREVAQISFFKRNKSSWF